MNLFTNSHLNRRREEAEQNLELTCSVARLHSLSFVAVAKLLSFFVAVFFFKCFQNRTKYQIRTRHLLQYTTIYTKLNSKRSFSNPPTENSFCRHTQRFFAKKFSQLLVLLVKITFCCCFFLPFSTRSYTFEPQLCFFSSNDFISLFFLKGF